MKLSVIYSYLSAGELKQQSLGGYEEGGIQPDKYKEINQHLNLGLLDLYARFPLKERELVLKGTSGKTLYVIGTEYTTSVDPVNGYILDSVEDPFEDDVLHFSSGFDSTGCEVPINDENAPYSVFTPNHKTLQIPYAGDGLIFYMMYRAKPATIVEGDLEQEVFLPESLLEHLLLYVEYRVHKARGGDTGISQSNIAKQQYELMCMQTESKNTLNSTSNVTNLKLEQNGWA